MLVAGSITGYRMLRSGGTSQRHPVQSLAVIPLENLSADSSQQYFAQAMTEQLTAELASLRSLQVISRAAAGRYDAAKTPPAQIARQLGIDAVLEGSVLRTADRVRVSLELIDGSSERHLWSRSYDRAIDGAMGIERQVARALADQLHLQLSAADQQRLQTPVTRNPEAYNAYLQAQYHLQQADKSLEESDKALQAAEEAVKLDPDFAEAYTAVAFASQIRIFFWQGGNEFLEKGLVAVEKALVLNPDLAEAYGIRGQLQYNQLHGFDLVRSIPDYRRAIALNPNLANAHHALGADLTHLGLHDEAIAEFHTALRLDPDSSGAKMRIGRALWQSNRFEEALADYERFHVIDFERSIVLAYLGRRPEAAEMLKAVDAAGTRANGPADLNATRAFLLALDGKQNRPQIDREMAQAEHLGMGKNHFHHAAFVMAAAYAELGDADRAMTWLEYTADHGMPNYPLFRDNPSTSKLRGNPRYDKFMRELQARWNEMVATAAPSGAS
jgi:TolB-like protein/lipoprotein NlpI